MKHVLVTGGAGMLGQTFFDLIAREKIFPSNRFRFTVIDKNIKAIQQLKGIYPDIRFATLDLSSCVGSAELFTRVDVVILMHARIKGRSFDEFHRDNVLATRAVLSEIGRYNSSFPKVIHISSSVCMSRITDWYSSSKTCQEEIVKCFASEGAGYLILRPTLMYGPFDTKHYGKIISIAKFSHVIPVFSGSDPVRQPLSAVDFCRIVIAGIKLEKTGTFNISGLETVGFLDCLDRMLTASGVSFIKIPLSKNIFRVLIALGEFLIPRAVFTAQQFDALVAGENFPSDDWPKAFGVRPTDLNEGLSEAVNHGK